MDGDGLDLHALLKREHLAPADEVDASIICTPLAAHQRRAHTWLAHLEPSPLDAADGERGGLVLDEMGLGKTLTMLAYALDERRRAARVAGHSNTLVVVPTLDVWRAQRDEHVARAHRARVLIVADRRALEQLARTLLASAGLVVVVRYSVLTTTFKHTPTAAVFTHRWLRCVLDEVHTIRRRAGQADTLQRRACYAVTAYYRWGLTGTPYLNEVAEPLSLVHWIRSAYMDEAAVRRSLAPATMATLQRAYAAHAIRRYREREHELHREDLVLAFDLQPAERRFYNALHRTGLRHVNATISLYERQPARERSTPFHVFDWIARLKQTCAHPYLVIAGSPRLRALFVQRYEACTGRTDRAPCCMTYERVLACAADCLDDMYLHPEVHVLEEAASDSDSDDDFADLSRRWLARQPAKRRRRLTSATEAHQRVEHVLRWLTPALSSKACAIVELMRARVAHDKFIVLSQWSRALRLFARGVCGALGVEYRLIDGKTAMGGRAAIVDAFQTQASVRVMFLTLKLGVSLTLTAANHVIFIDEWWNEAQEQQAAARADRWGQTKDVWVYNLHMRDTIDTCITDLRSRKLAESEEALGNATAVASASSVTWIERVRLQMSAAAGTCDDAPVSRLYDDDEEGE